MRKRAGLLSGVLLGAGALGPAAGAAQDGPYFQQGVDYRIEATLDEATDVLSGRARLTYVNRSSDTLDRLYLHQHLNAFRPNSAWARRELGHGERRFQDLGPDAHAFERLTLLEVDGRAVAPVHPGAPDSTVVLVPLPEPLEPGGTVVLDMDWEARLSTLPRREGRQGRHFDFAQWYPRIAVYDRGGWQQHPLLPQGEFYGEFAAYDVTLELAEDQVVGATGVPVAGDPGWRRTDDAAELGRDAYGDVPPPMALGLLGSRPAPGRKHVRWRAEDVHHFAWSADPAYVHEGGRVGETLIHALFLPADTAWDDGVAVERTERALRWLEDVFGPYPYPQVTNVHRLEGGGTEFPMLVMDGDVSQGLIVHEVGHIYVHGIFANNEWRDAWLDEGFSSFLTYWFIEEEAPNVWRDLLTGLAEREAAGATAPVATPAADFVDYGMYGAMSYHKGSVFFHMLRHHIGEDAFREGLRRYYREHRLRHVREEDLRQVMEAASGEDLEWFFRQWLHGTARLDYGIESARTRRGADGGWETTVEVVRRGEAWMPVTLEVGGVERKLISRDRRQTVTIPTSTRPEEAVLDPGLEILDIDRSNDRAEVTAAAG